MSFFDFFLDLFSGASKNNKPDYANMKKLLTIAGVSVEYYNKTRIDFTAKAAIDADGSDNRHGDKYWQPDTSLRLKGKSIDAEEVPYIVVPPQVILAVPGIVLGAKARITNIKTGASSWAVVADVGPRKKIGELSCEAARRVGLSGNPNTGGTDEKIIRYEIWPNIPANVDGIEYDLQPYNVSK